MNSLIRITAPVFLAICILISAISCQTPRAVDKPATETKVDRNLDSSVQLRSLAIEKLSALLTDEGLVPATKNSDGAIVVKGTKIEIRGDVEHELNREGQFLYAARFETQLTGLIQAKFTVGSIGIGVSKADARETSVEEWVNLFGRALMATLQESGQGTEIGRYIAFAGATGVRGAAPQEGIFSEGYSLHRMILKTLQSTIRSSTNDIISLNLMINVNERGEVNGESRLNDEVSESLHTSLKQLNWPKSPGGYIFKQFYILKKR